MSSRNALPVSESLAASEAVAAAGATAPRVSLEDLEANIAHAVYFTAAHAVISLVDQADPIIRIDGDIDWEGPTTSLDLLTLCLLTTRNGFTIVGKSAAASAENFDREKGRKFAYEDAVRQLWPLMGYALRDRVEIAQNLRWLVPEPT